MYSGEIWRFQGENGSSALQGPFKELEKAKESFEKKFYEKTRNKWSNRDNFKAVAGKYTLLDMGEDDDEIDDSCIVKTSTPVRHVFFSTL
jgi:poly [ADP-ribose] polymerase